MEPRTDSTEVCRREPRWCERSLSLHVMWAGIVFCRWRFRALELDTPVLWAKDYPPPPPLASLPETISVVHIHAVPCAEASVRRLTFLPDSVRYLCNVKRRYFISLEGSFGDYLQKFGAKSRGNLKRNLRKFLDASGPSGICREFRAPAEMAEFQQLACSISSKSYQERLSGAGLDQSDAFREHLIAQAESDAIRGYVLFHGDVPAAYGYCYAYGTVLLLDRMAFDSAFKSKSPGSVLIHQILQRLFSDRFSVLDFGPGEFDYKKRFSTGNVLAADLYIVRRTAANIAQVCRHLVFRALVDRMNDALQGLGLRHRLRTLLHHGNWRWRTGR